MEWKLQSKKYKNKENSKERFSIKIGSSQLVSKIKRRNMYKTNQYIL